MPLKRAQSNDYQLTWKEVEQAWEYLTCLRTDNPKPVRLLSPVLKNLPPLAWNNLWHLLQQEMEDKASGPVH